MGRGKGSDTLAAACKLVPKIRSDGAQDAGASTRVGWEGTYAARNTHRT